MTEEIEELKKTIETLKNEINKKFEELNEKIDYAESDLESSIEQHSGYCDCDSSDIDKIIESLEGGQYTYGLHEKVDELESSIHKIIAVIAKLEEKLNFETSKAETFGKSLSKIEKAIKRIEKTLDQLQPKETKENQPNI